MGDHFCLWLGSVTLILKLYDACSFQFVYYTVIEMLFKKYDPALRSKYVMVLYRTASHSDVFLISLPHRCMKIEDIQ